ACARAAAGLWPFTEGPIATAPGPLKKVMSPILNGVPGIFPLAGSAALSNGGPATAPAPTRPAPPTVTPSLLRKSRRPALAGFSICFLPFADFKNYPHAAASSDV